jgi:hypothetical protein
LPIVGWSCPSCKADVPLDHFETTPCGRARDGRPSVHPSFAAAVLKHDREHYARDLGVAEVSSGLSCPRESGIMRSENVYVNPGAYNASLGGTSWHSLMEGTQVPGVVTEYVVRGSLGMVPIIGKIDMLRRDHLLIEDWKTKTDWKFAGIERDGAEPNDIAQISIYAALVEQQDGWRPIRGAIWYRYHAKGLAPKEIPKLMREEEFLAYKPTKGEQYTVLDLLRATDANIRGVIPWQDIPLVGEGLFYGAKDKCSYCPAFTICKTQAYGAPF